MMAVSVDWAMLGPILTLGVAACVLLLVAATPARRGPAPFILALAGLGATGGSLLALAQGAVGQSTLGNMLVVDHAALFISSIILLAALLAVLLSRQYLERAPAPAAEYYALLLLSVLGMMVMSSTNNLLVVFMGLEILSVALYVLAGITRDWMRSLEAALKYFLLGAFSTGFILYGMAFLYGASGSLDLMVISSKARELLAAPGGEGAAPMLLLGLGLMMVGLFFKVAAVPFHWWAPDVYEGSPTPVTAFMAVGTKAAAFLVLLRLVTSTFGDVLVPQWTMVLGGVALLSMLVGNLVALVQRNIKRMLAFSSVAHAGYLLVAVAAGSDLGTSAMLFYFASYVLTTLGAFGIAGLVAETTDAGDEGYGLRRYAGLSQSNPGLALAMTVFMLSLIGVPPTAGFIGKYFIFQAAIQRAMEGQKMFLVLSVVGILLSVVSAAYYLRVIVTMYMAKPDGDLPQVRTSPDSGFVVLAAVAGIFYLGLFPTFIYDMTRALHTTLQALAVLWI